MKKHLRTKKKSSNPFFDDTFLETIYSDPVNDTTLDEEYEIDDLLKTYHIPDIDVKEENKIRPGKEILL